MASSRRLSHWPSAISWRCSWSCSRCLLMTLVEWQRQIQVAAALLVIAFGIFRLLDRRHPRALARIPPAQLGLWSFAVAIAHGAGLMLVPIYLGLCTDAGLGTGHAAAGSLIGANVDMVVLVALVHTTAMIAAGGVMAWLDLSLSWSSGSCRGAGSIWTPYGQGASSWSAHWRLPSASRASTEAPRGQSSSMVRAARRSRLQSEKEGAGVALMSRSEPGLGRRLERNRRRMISAADKTSAFASRPSSRGCSIVVSSIRGPRGGYLPPMLGFFYGTSQDTAAHRRLRRGRRQGPRALDPTAPTRRSRAAMRCPAGS